MLSASRSDAPVRERRSRSCAAERRKESINFIAVPPNFHKFAVQSGKAHAAAEPAPIFEIVTAGCDSPTANRFSTGFSSARQLPVPAALDAWPSTLLMKGGLFPVRLFIVAYPAYSDKARPEESLPGQQTKAFCFPAADFDHTPSLFWRIRRKNAVFIG